MKGEVNRRIFVIHGRNHVVRDQVVAFLRALDLEVTLYDDVRRLAGTRDRVLDLVVKGIKASALVISLFTPDEWTVLRGDLRKHDDVESEQRRWLSRPNVIFETGLALGIAPRRVVYLLMGDVSLFSDVLGDHVFRPTNRTEVGSDRQKLHAWLTAWFARRGVDLPETSAWKTEGDFESGIGSRAKPKDILGGPSAGWPWLERDALAVAMDGSGRDFDPCGDTIEISPWTATSFRANLAPSPEGAQETFEGQLVLTRDRQLVERWTEPYSEAVRAYVLRGIELESSGGRENAKVGFVSIDFGLNALNTSSGLSFRPVNHLVAQAFNRRLALERTTIGSYGGRAHQLWNTCLRNMFPGVQSVRACHPSQVFVELAVITSDGYVPCTQKSDSNSVYAKRHAVNTRRGGARVWTCGVELGPNWGQVMTRVGESAFLEVDLVGGAVAALKREFGIDVPNGRIEHPMLAIKKLVLQTLHLNVSFIGYCIVPETREEVLAKCSGKQMGGMDHRRLYFVPFVDGDKQLEHEDSTSWHGTAMARFKVLEEFESEIRQVLWPPPTSVTPV